MNASHDLSDLIQRLEWAKLGKNPGDKKAMKRLADEIKRRTDMKGLQRMDYGDKPKGVCIRHDGTLEAELPQQAERGVSGGAGGEVRHYAHDESKHPRGQPENAGQFVEIGKDGTLTDKTPRAAEPGFLGKIAAWFKGPDLEEQRTHFEDTIDKEIERLEKHAPENDLKDAKGRRIERAYKAAAKALFLSKCTVTQGGNQYPDAKKIKAYIASAELRQDLFNMAAKLHPDLHGSIVRASQQAEVSGEAVHFGFTDEGVMYQWDESQHPRGQPENKGQFGKGGGGTATKETPAKKANAQNQKQQRKSIQIGSNGVMAQETAPAKGNAIVAKMKAAGAMAAHAEHVAKEYAVDKIDRAVSKLPGWAQTTVKGIYAVACAGTKVAFAAWTASQALAERVAVERGSTPEEARKLKGVLCAIDIAAFKPVAILTAGSAGLAAASWIIPPATGLYLAYSTARNPLAVAKAAVSMVKDGLITGVIGAAIVGIAVKEKLNFAEGEGDTERGDLAADALEAHQYDDWYIALLSACMDGCPNLEAAIAGADKLHKKQPSAPESSVEIGPDGTLPKP